MLKSVFVDKICPKGQGQGHDRGCVFGNINFLVKFVEQIYQTYKLTAAAYTDSLTPVITFAYADIQCSSHGFPLSFNFNSLYICSS